MKLYLLTYLLMNVYMIFIVYARASLILAHMNVCYHSIACSSISEQVHCVHCFTGCILHSANLPFQLGPAIACKALSAKLSVVIRSTCQKPLQFSFTNYFDFCHQIKSNEIKFICSNISHNISSSKSVHEQGQQRWKQL